MNGEMELWRNGVMADQGTISDQRWVTLNNVITQRFGIQVSTTPLLHYSVSAA